MITTLFFDLDDTLLDFKKAEAIALSRTLTEAGVTPTPEITALYSAINQSQWELLERGRITRPQLFTRRFDLLFQQLGLKLDSRRIQSLYVGFLGQGHYFIPGAEELLETLSGRYPMYLLSNGTASVQDSRLQSAGISRYFQDIFISERVGFHKPGTEFFDHCFAVIGGNLDRREVLMTGDSLTSDILGGNNAGIQTCWFNPKGKPRRADIPADYEISALSQLPELLERI